jgi:pimeloyl-ACP methyl ester carboxylesterase
MTLKYDPAIFGRRPAVDLLSKLTMVACSTMIVRGAYSSVLSKAEALRLAQTSCVTDFCEIAMAGHAIMSENPEDLVKRLNHFFEQLSYGLLRAWSLAPGSTR